ncbi:MAG: DMT family transporter [Arenicellales bacterium]
MTRAQHLPSITVVIAASMWGLFWLPLRAFERNGLDPAWTTLGQFIAPLIILLPVAFFRFMKSQTLGLGNVSSSLLIGAAFVLYYESLLLTSVVKALILFYITPTWSTLLEVTVMKKRFSLWRGLSLALGISGLLVILSQNSGIPVPRNLGDVMAILSGILFSLGTMGVRRASNTSSFDQMFSFFFYGSLVGFAIAFLPFSQLGSPPTIETMLRLGPWLILMSVCLIIPMMWALLWASQFIDPGRLGILLQMEAIVGITSAALFAGEPYGLRELTGTLLVLSAGLVDIYGHRYRA